MMTKLALTTYSNECEERQARSKQDKNTSKGLG